jgi:hypothetical protein
MCSGTVVEGWRLVRFFGAMLERFREVLTMCEVSEVRVKSGSGVGEVDGVKLLSSREVRCFGMMPAVRAETRAAKPLG